MRFLAILLLAAPAAYADYSQHPKAPQLYEQLRSEHGFSEAELRGVYETLKAANKVEKLIEKEQTAKEKTLTWDSYRKIHVHDRNIENGIKLLREQSKWLARAEEQFGVPPHVIAAVLGVETKYGSYTGKARVLDALATQGFDHPTRTPFFFSELVAFFALCKERGFDPTGLQGSYAGAMGAAQFMPSNYRRLALDYDNSGSADLWSLPDAIGSIGNYLVNYDKSRAWQRGAPMMVRASVVGDAEPDVETNKEQATNSLQELIGAGIKPAADLQAGTRAGLVRLDLDAAPPEGATQPEYWIGFSNFYSLMSYNPRVYYAMSVAQLAEAIRDGAAE